LTVAAPAENTNLGLLHLYWLQVLTETEIKDFTCISAFISGPGKALTLIFCAYSVTSKEKEK
jgi:hypothetical protein